MLTAIESVSNIPTYIDRVKKGEVIAAVGAIVVGGVGKGLKVVVVEHGVFSWQGQLALAATPYSNARHNME